MKPTRRAAAAFLLALLAATPRVSADTRADFLKLIDRPRVPLIAPRPLRSINGGIDPRTPLPALNLCADAARAAYRAAGAEEKSSSASSPTPPTKSSPSRRWPPASGSSAG